MATIVRPGLSARRGALRAAFAIGLLASLAASSIGPVAAGAIRFSEPVDDLRYAPATSAACGFDVYLHFVGTATTKLYVDAQGNVVRELDGAADLHVTWFSPDTGKSYAFPVPGMLRTLYYGNEPGDPAIAELIGLQDGTPDARDAGYIVFPAVFIGFGPFGIPDIDIAGDPLKVAGTWNGDFRIAARCAALAP